MWRVRGWGCSPRAPNTTGQSGLSSATGQIHEAPAFPCPLHPAEGLGYCMSFFFFFNNSFIEIHFKCYTVYPLKVCHLVVIYKVYHSQTGANITTLYFGNIFIIPKRTPVLLSGHCPQPQAATSLISVSMELPVLDISCEYNM